MKTGSCTIARGAALAVMIATVIVSSPAWANQDDGGLGPDRERAFGHEGRLPVLNYPHVLAGHRLSGGAAALLQEGSHGLVPAERKRQRAGVFAGYGAVSAGESFQLRVDGTGNVQQSGGGVALQAHDGLDGEHVAAVCWWWGTRC